MSHFGPAISHETANDPLFRMRAYRLAVDLLEVAWNDAKVLSAEPVTERIAGQLYAAVASIGANLGEGYSRSSGKDRSRIFEYALGSVRESMSWYEALGQTPLVLAPRSSLRCVVHDHDVRPPRSARHYKRHTLALGLRDLRLVRQA
jgi:four helix bundle protein